VFVPEHRLLSYPKATAYQSPGSALNPATIYKTAFVPMLVLNLAGTALGIGERALSDFVETIKARGQSGGAYPLTGMKRIDSAAAHNVVAEATVQVEGARMILNRAGATIRECAAGEQMTREIGAKVSFQTSYAARQCMDAVRALFLQSGGGVLHPDHFMQQAFQDITAVNVHGFLSHEAHTTLYGAFALGHENPKAFL
jgi:alkylation response protein AidB-like acyl-CoA dehydrogenase